MRKITVLLLSLFLSLTHTSTVSAQTKAQTTISAVKQKGTNVNFTLSSTRPFLYAGNRYILYVGDKEFTRYDQVKLEGKDNISFIVPVEAYKTFRDGDAMYLTYGKLFHEGADRAAVAKQNKRCWSLGKFSPSLLTK